MDAMLQCNGASKEAVMAYADAIMSILNSDRSDQVVMTALDTLEQGCRTNYHISHCSFVGTRGSDGVAVGVSASNPDIEDKYYGI